MKRILFSLFLAVSFSLAAQAAAKPKPQRVYMFGFAVSLSDSAAYMTDLQGVDAYVMPNGFLADRALYSLQLNNYMVGTLRRENMTCAIFFDKKKAKAEKRFQRLRRKYRENPAVTLTSLGVDAFRFEPEEYVETVVVETPAKAAETPSAQTTVPATADKKNKKGKKK